MDRTRKQWAIDTILLVVTMVVLYSYVLFNAPQPVNHILSVGLDDQIPRLPAFAISYLAFLPWLYGTLVFAWFKNRYFRQLAYSFIVINLIAFLVYLTFQTYVPREAITSHDVFSNILQFVYSHDLPYAGFPSLHAALSASIASYFVIRCSKWSWAAVTMAILVVVSTLFIKQHFIVDAVSGVTLGIFVTWGMFKLFAQCKGLADYK